MKRVINTIKSLLIDDGEDNQNKKNKLLRNIVILGMIGILLLLSGNLFKTNVPERKSDTLSVPVENKGDYKKEISYEEQLARELEKILTVMEGVGRVSVIVNVDTYSSYDFEYNVNKTTKTTSEMDTNGGERKIDEENNRRELVVIRDGSGSESPVMKKKEAPAISGIMIVAQGAENSSIKYEITNAVSRLLNLPVHKISVLPYEYEERR